MSEMSWHCERCGAHYPVGTPRYVCDCPSAGRLDLSIDIASIPGRAGPEAPSGSTTAPGLWRYSRLLPIGADDEPARLVGSVFPAGGTPLHRVDRLARKFGLTELWIKNEAANPTGSLKDRASAMVLAAALAFRAPVVATASTGNAAAAMAAAGAACGVPCVAFVPARASAGRIGQLLGFGARVLVVDGDYDDAVRLCLAACDEWGWFCRTSAVNPYTAQGKKTAALEILDQLGWSVPDAVVVSAGDGNILVGLHRGFRDAYRLGWVDRLPRLVAVQATGAPALYRAWLTGATETVPSSTATVADGIAVGSPLDGFRALGAVRQTGGAVAAVPDAAILAAQEWLARLTGITAEPSSAAAVAALPELLADQVLMPTDRVVVVNTGGAGRSGGRRTDAVRVRPELADVAAALPDLSRVPPGRRVAGLLSGVSGT